MDLEGDHTIGETFPLFSRNRSVCVGVCFFLQKVSLPEFNVVERLKETRQMAYPHHLMTWSSELRHELDTVNIITSFLKNLVVGPVNVWNCEVGRSIQATLFSLTFSHNHFEFTDPLPWLPTSLFKLYSLLPGCASERLCIPLFLCWRHLI